MLMALGSLSVLLLFFPANWRFSFLALSLAADRQICMRHCIHISIGEPAGKCQSLSKYKRLGIGIAMAIAICHLVVPDGFEFESEPELHPKRFQPPLLRFRAFNRRQSQGFFLGGRGRKTFLFMAKEAKQAKVKFFNDYFLLIFGGRFFCLKSFAQTLVSFIPTLSSFFSFVFLVFGLRIASRPSGGRRR